MVNKYIVLQNTAKTRLLRESLFNLLGNDKTISFCYRQENELDDANKLLYHYVARRKFLIHKIIVHK